MGKPGAILLIGAGTFILVMGWTGKLSAVWDALRGTVPGGESVPGGTSDDGSTNEDGSGPGKVANPKPETPGPGENAKTCGSGQQLVVLKTNNQARCIQAVFLAAPDNPTRPGECRDGWLEGVRMPDGLKVCVSPVRAAGAVANDYATVILPTGASARRYQPNVRATD